VSKQALTFRSTLNRSFRRREKAKPKPRSQCRQIRNTGATGPSFKMRQFMGKIVYAQLVKSSRNATIKTSVWETIRKPPLVKAQIEFKKKNKKNMAKNDSQYGGWNSYTLQCGTIMTLVSPGDCTLERGMWLRNHGSEFTKWQHRAM